MSTSSFSQIVIGTISPDSSAILDLTSTTKGFLVPRITNAQKNLIAGPAAGLQVWCTNCGTSGELQVFNGATWTNIIGGSASIDVPGAPTSPVATAGNAQATVSFSAPVNIGGSAITGYTVTSSPGNVTVPGTSTSIVVTGLTNGTSYTFTVMATNAYGNSVASLASASVTPCTVPDSPTSPSAVAGYGQASVSFNSPVYNGGSAITGYTAYSSSGHYATGASSPIVVTGLSNGTSYTFTVRATNAAGNSVASSASASVTTFSVPNSPTSPSAVAGNAQATVSFSPPGYNGGSAITGYIVTSSPGGVTASGGSSPIVVTGLSNGTPYTFTVRATNAYGNSVASLASASVTPFSVPNSPTSPIAVAGIGQATVSFSPPVNNGGSAITAYTVTSSPGGFTASGTSTSIEVYGLTNGTSYTFTVLATNAYGNSVASLASASVTPCTVPGYPTSPSAVAGIGQATVSFSPPEYDGGSAITGYIVYSSSGHIAIGASSPIVVTGLSNGTPYNFTVRATNAAGNSFASSASEVVTTFSVPDAPTSPSAVAGNAQATVSFSPPEYDGSPPEYEGGSAITSYTVTSSPGGVTASGTSTSIEVYGLTNGTSYTFTVRAVNAVGFSVASSASAAVTTFSVPDSPASPSAVEGNAQATVSFSPPVNNGGSAITSYTVTSSPGGVTASGGSSPIVVTGLTNGTSYTFTVRAVNAVGFSVASSASAAVTIFSVPDSPTSPSAVAGIGQATVSFSPPGYNGGSAITGYTVTSSPGGVTASGGSSPIVVTGLTNGTSYTFTARATNALGNSVASVASNSILGCGVFQTFVYNNDWVTYGTVASSGKCWLDRNLGATQVATYSTDFHSYGDLFQWGRRADGHQNIEWISSTSSNYEEQDNQTTLTSSYDIALNALFIIPSYGEPYDWRSPQNDNLWQGLNGINNPCPLGFRLPSLPEWEAERASWSSNTATGAFASPLKMTSAGMRSPYAGLYNTGNVGEYWSSSVSSARSSHLWFGSFNSSTSTEYRSWGLSVRCIAN
jgi:hypothetical protein